MIDYITTDIRWHVRSVRFHVNFRISHSSLAFPKSYSHWSAMQNRTHLLASIALFVFIRNVNAASIYDSGGAITIRSVLETRTSNNRTLVSYFTESYSFSSGVAKIDNYQEMDFSRSPSTEFYYLRHRNLAVSIDSNGKCKESSLGEFITGTHMNLINSITSSNDPILIGPSQVMKFVMDRRAELKEVGLQAVTNHTVYNLAVNNGKILLTVYYPSNTASTIPNRINIQEQKRPEVAVMILHVRNSNQMGSWNPGQEIISDTPKFDAFSLPRLSGCFDEFKRDGFDLFDTSNFFRSTRFTFKAEVVFRSTMSGYSDESSYFVAYDGALQLMRVDSIDSGTKRGTSNLINFYEKFIDYQLDDSDEPKAIPDSIDTFDAPENFIEAKATSAKLKCHGTRLDLVNVNQKLEDKLEYVSTGRLMIGADKFVLLGSAQVRGITADVYETETKSLPIWLEPPILTKCPDADRVPEFEFKSYTTLVYLASDESEQLNPLLIEIYEICESRPNLLYASISLREFAWNLETESRTGVKPMEFFSLPRCHSSNLMLSDFAQVEMILQQTNKSKTSSSFSVAPITLNLAILGALNEFLSLPADMIHNLESRQVTEIVESRTMRSLALKFIIADHEVAPMVNLKFVTRRQVPIAQRIVKEATLSACYLRAASVGSEVIQFAYSRLSKYCYIGLDRGNEINDRFLHMEINVFEIRDDTKASRKDMARVLKDFRSQIRGGNQGKKLKLRGLNGMNLEYFVERANIQEHKAQQAISKFGYVDSEKLIGFALAPSTGGSSSSIKLKIANGLSHCRSLCFKDLHCNSYSICLSGSTVDCVTSTAQFTIADLAVQLGSKSSGKNKHISVQVLDGLTGVDKIAELERHVTCELHVKDHLEMFRSIDTRAKNYRTNALQVAERGSEDCARKCFQNNLVWLEKYALTDAKVDMLVKGKQFCEQFGYADDHQLGEKMRKYFHVNLDDTSQGGYCLFTHDWSLMPNYASKVDLDSAKLSHFVPPQLFLFKSEAFFELDYGIGLKKSAMNNEHLGVYRNIDSGRQLTQQELTIMNDFLEGNGNLQEVHVLDDTQCAFACLMQIISPWPSCRSFDIVEMVDENQSRKECRLNSATLRDVFSKSREDLIYDEQTSAIGYRISHFEPMVYLDTKAIDLIKGSGEPPLQRPSGFELPILLLVAFSGALIGLAIGKRLLQLTRSRADILNNRRESQFHMTLDDLVDAN